jgi:3',5'-cyclic AMP phosphodiesterase CpdA
MSPHSCDPLLRFGMLADPQYAPIPACELHDRHYARSLDKLAVALARLDEEALDFIVVLGDLIERDWENFDAVLALFAASRHECLLIPGNHDFAVAPERLGEVYGKLGMPAPYYQTRRRAVQLIFLNGNEVSLFAPPPGDARRALAEERLAELMRAGVANAFPWNAGISEAQFQWLRRQLVAAAEMREPALVFGHYPVHPFFDHALWDAERVAALLAASPAAIAYFCGHYHHGGYARRGHTHFINARGIVDTPDDNAFSIVTLYPDRLVVEGFGREESRDLPVSLAFA